MVADVGGGLGEARVFQPARGPPRSRGHVGDDDVRRGHGPEVEDDAQCHPEEGGRDDERAAQEPLIHERLVLLQPLGLTLTLGRRGQGEPAHVEHTDVPLSPLEVGRSPGEVLLVLRVRRGPLEAGEEQWPERIVEGDGRAWKQRVIPGGVGSGLG